MSLLPTDAELEVEQLKPEQRRLMAELALVGYKFKPFNDGRFLIYTPEGKPVYASMSNGNGLATQIDYCRRHSEGERNL